MASIIKLKRSSTQSAVPGSLEVGEIAVNLFDRRLYIGNTTGVTAVGGEVFKLTTQDSGSEGAYLKLLGESVPTTNSVFLQAGEGIDITRQSNGTITFSGENASDTNKGIASFDSGDFSVSSGAVSLADSATGAVIAINGTTNEVNVSRSNGTVTVGLPDDVTITGQLNVNENIVVNGNTAVNSITATTIQANGAVTISGATALNGGLTMDTNKFTVADTTGNVATAGTLNVTGLTTLDGGLVMDTNKFTVADGTGNVSTAGTLSVTGISTLTGDVTAQADLTVNGDLTVDGNLQVEGALTYLSTSTVYTDDGMMKLSANNAGDITDTGIYSKYVVSGNSAVQYAGYYRDASDGIFKFYTGLDLEPTTTVDNTDTGYGLAQVDAIIDGGSY